MTAREKYREAMKEVSIPPTRIDSSNCLKSETIPNRNVLLGAKSKKVGRERVYECNFCSKEMVGKKSLATHIATHTKEKAHACDQCNYASCDPNKVMVHRKMVHTTLNPVPCKLCKKIFKSKYHLREHDCTEIKERKFSCEACGKKFQAPHLARSHWKRVHTDYRPFSCPDCPGKFKAKSELKLHSEIHQLSEERTFKCPSCPKMFRRKKNMKSHASMHKVTGEIYVCDKCPKKFPAKNLLRQHSYIHAPGKLKCNLCGKDFRCTMSLEIHVRSHTKERPYACNSCKRGFSSENQLKDHSRVHSEGGEPKHKCTECNWETLYKTRLTVHLRTHTGEKPFACSVCPKKFTSRPQLKSHMNSHSKEVKFNCDQCEATFRSRRGFKNHTRIHSGIIFQCPLCPVKRYSEADLLLHSVIHTTEKPFACHLCPKTFSAIRNFNYHKKMAHDLV